MFAPVKDTMHIADFALQAGMLEPRDAPAHARRQHYTPTHLDLSR